ncbi:MAG: alpha/beta fold hydrolase [Gammaproteobacteria bacterium]|nr:alpha/beta fold hydrolase [Gammaproteobacteria bacterium]MDE2108602.1 alpha/beta fold hydrolase [Gammaproteobacteria bacterium]
MHIPGLALWFSLLVAAAVLPTAPAQAATSSQQLEFSGCQIGAPDSPQHLEAKCTTLMAPEDRARPDGKKIGLHIAVLRARAGEPAPDPLFFIAGGPGEASTQSFVKLAPAFDDIRKSRDIVLVDQRGTGESNALNCPAEPHTNLAPSAAEIAQQIQACLKQLPGDPRFYTTTMAVQDLDAVRQALGYREIDLYGISYGTRVALEYLREFPQQVRSVVLDGVVPADLTIGPGVSLDAQQALNGIFARCQQDADCHKTFPDLAKTFAKLRQTLEQHPVTVNLRDPLSGAPLTETLTWPEVTNAVRFMSYASETAALLPLLIHQAGAAQDYVPLMANALFFTEQINGSIALGMNAAVLCTEDVPFYKTDAATQQTTANTYIGAMPVTQLIETCKHWPQGIIEADFKQPVVSDKPVLLISGQDDPITPPSNAADAARTLTNSLSIVVPGQGHGNAYRGCVPRLMAEFVAQASVKKLDTACVSKIQPFPFFTSFTGPGP